MPRISVSLPEEFMGRLEPIKESINVSQVCREALEKRIAAFELAANHQGGNVDMEDLINRLREEREVVEGKFEELGRNNAAAWLSTSAYLELKNVAESDGVTDLQSFRLPRAAFRIMKEDMEEAKVGIEGAHAVMYKTAWLDYVRVVWAGVMDRVEEPINGVEPVKAPVKAKD